MEISKVSSAKDWEYFAKGNANILFKYVGPNDYLKRRLLRLRLLKNEEEYISTCELYDFIELKCKPLFPNEIIDIQLVVLTTTFIKQLDCKNNQLMMNERYGLVLPNMLYGDYDKINLSKYVQMYIENTIKESNRINPQDGIPAEENRVTIFEIKPKWLYDNSQNYCRTCSLNQHRNQKRHFCPLDLLYPETIDQGLTDFFSKIPKHILDEVESRLPIQKLFNKYLRDEHNVFQKLKQYQRINNKNDLICNLNSADDVSKTLSLIMTLRDVGLFLRFERYNPDNDNRQQVKTIIELDGKKYIVSCNIYDLDLKSRMKYKHWYQVEEQLKDIYSSNNKDWRFCVRKNVEGNLET